MKRIGMAALIGLFWSATAAQAQSAPVDPATIETPPLDFVPTASETKSFVKYFYFHKPGVSFDQARADLEECYDNARSGQPPSIVPTSVFATLDDVPANRAPSRYRSTGYGVVGDVIGGMLANSANFQLSQSRLRICMGFKGYNRYGANRKLWDQLAGDEASDRILIQAKIASGPAPAAKPIAP